MKSARIFLTGEPGVGKTTLIRKVVQELQSRGIIVGGMTSSEIREGGSRIGFQVEDISSHEVGELAKLGQTFQGAPMVGRYRVNLDDVERVGVVAIRHALKVANVIIVDEIGPMELKSSQFVLAVEDVLASSKNFLGTLHKRASHPLIKVIRTNSSYKIIELTPANRNMIQSEVIAQFVG
ncbi:MAG TPA: NTPase [Candidatus Bathyarchaeia archaeon]|nr:NTPase [Candidatus Bathyarchaeia archaeon]